MTDQPTDDQRTDRRGHRKITRPTLIKGIFGEIKVLGEVKTWFWEKLKTWFW